MLSNQISKVRIGNEIIIMCRTIRYNENLNLIGGSRQYFSLFLFASSHVFLSHARTFVLQHNLAPQAPQNPADGKILGVTPLPFIEERDRVEEFINAVENHFLLNHKVTSYHSARTRIAYTLSLLQGPDVASWR